MDVHGESRVGVYSKIGIDFIGISEAVSFASGTEASLCGN